ncbi:MAG: FtsK/SpoIIIE domain-containing protein [Chloroflexota bacterium]
MTKPNRFDLVLQALAELAPELENAHTDLGPALPTLSEVLTELGPLPREALFLGIAEDGLPVLLDLGDPAPGPLLVAGDEKTGKTTFLKTIVHAAAAMHEPEGLQFGVVTANPEEWEQENELPNSAGVYPVYDNSAMDFILGLTAWAHNNRGSRQAVLLLIDDLESLAKLDFDARQNLRWLLLRGPNRRVWPVATLNAGRSGKSLEWLESFRTRIFGRIRHTGTARELSRTPNASLENIVAGTQFAMRENNNWLNFWIPALDAG